jgi:hypothetical protein
MNARQQNDRSYRELEERFQELEKRTLEQEETIQKLIGTLVNLYTKKTHFVYELLQNAEDAGATRVYFAMHDGYLELLHDGLPFTQQNLDAIRNPASSDKIKLTEKDGLTRIGKFGIGFLATYTICNTVKFWSEPKYRRQSDSLPSFAYEIQNYTKLEPVPEEWTPDPKYKYTTRFVFPFVCGKHYKSPAQLRKDLAAMLKELGAEVMLYLKNIESVEYVIYHNKDDKTISDHKEFFLKRTPEQSKDSSGKKRTRIASYQGKPGDSEKISDYIMYSKDSAVKDKTVDLVFAVEDNGGKVTFATTPEKHRFISVYFHTQMESKLRFMIQAPFSTTPNRESIPDTDENKPIVEAAAELLREVVLDVKQRGELSLDFLNILPYEDHASDWLLMPMYYKTIQLFRSGETGILPAIDGGVTTAENAYIAYEKKLTELFDGEKLCALVGKKNAVWMSTNLTSSNKPLAALYHFLIEKTEAKLIYAESLSAMLREPNPHPLWNAVGDEWLVRFYNWLGEYHKSSLGFDSGEKRRDFTSVHFIKTDSGTFEAAWLYDDSTKVWTPNLYMSSEDTSHAVGKFKFVNKKIVDNCPNFLEAMRINKPDDYDYLVAELESQRDGAEVSEDEAKSQVKRAVKLLNDGRVPDAAVPTFKSKLLLRYLDTKTKEPEHGTLDSLASKKDLYLEFDAADISLLDYFDGIGGRGVIDANFYIDDKITRHVLATALGKLGIYDAILEYGKNPKQYTNCGEFKKELNFRSIDVLIRNMSPLKSKAIWHLLRHVANQLAGEGRYGAGSNVRFENGVSVIVETLRVERWLYHTNGSAACPSEISKNELDTALYGTIDPYICELLNVKEDPKEAVLEIITALPHDELQSFVKQIIAENFSDEDRRKLIAQLTA